MGRYLHFIKNMRIYVLRVLVCWLHFIVCAARTAPSARQSLKDHLAITNCGHLEAPPPAAQYQEGNLNCSTTTYEEPSNYSYYDNERIMIKASSYYTAFKGFLNFKENTPKYCFSNSNQGQLLDSFDIHFKSESPQKLVGVELTPCRGSYWTNGKVICFPWECDRFSYRNGKYDGTSYRNLDVEINMHDLNKLPDGTSIIKFEGSSDPRTIYNIELNETDYLTTQQFLSFCKDDGPCYKGKFLKNNNVLYQYGGRPPLEMMKLGNKAVIGFRYDPRDFIFPEKSLDKRCSFKANVSSEICNSPSGRHAWKILWQFPLPFPQEWLKINFFVGFSYLTDCTFDLYVYINGKKKQFLSAKSPCGQHADMKLGHYPYPTVGVYGKDKNGDGEFKMRFRGINMW